ncbi:hypothetical protein FJT64_017155 [Amphibalanus amphitrite]|uniref:Major facilitator superfamily (MFS) profile domain-containing protein n=1 Tax=Amphibalanus amphitrite TaxID=1232801 RepID=A0A6A4X3J1_AMPAM|nr:hypothetical protein FJT64_017155 [Amphibalanus amphitrite]
MCRRLLQLVATSCTEQRRRLLRRRLSYVVIICNFFLGGFEYGVIFPTAMDYLGSLGAEDGRETTLFGLLIVSYAAANIIGGYVGGLWADMFVETRPLLVLAALPQIIGNALYFFAGSPVTIIGSRALSGLGSGANTAMLAELTRTTSLTHRTSVIGVITFSRQLGIVHRVTLLNAPGLLLMLCYLGYMVLLTLFYSNLTVDKDESGSGVQMRRPALTPVVEDAAGAASVETGTTPEARVCSQCSGQQAMQEKTRQRRLAREIPKTAESTPNKRPSSAPQTGPTPQNTPVSRGKPGAAATEEGSSHTPQRPLVLSLPQPSPNQCSSWPPYRPLAASSEDDRDSAEAPTAASGKPSDSLAPKNAHHTNVVWPHTPDHQPPSSHCPHGDKCPVPFGPCRPSPVSAPAVSPSPSVSVVREWRELLCWPIAALLLCNFAAYMTQTSLEALLPALVERDLHMEIDATGKIFIAGGLVQCAVLLCIFLTPFLPCMHDQRLISGGLLVMILAHVQILVTICMLRDSAVDAGGPAGWQPPSWGWGAASPSPLPPRDQRWFWVVLVGSGVQFFGYPLVNSVVTSFMSKMLSRGAQGVGAAGLRLSMCIGLMLGPVWGSGMLHYELPLLLLPLGILLCSLILFYWFERCGGFRERMRKAAVVDTVTPRVCAAPRRLRTISALSQIREVAADGASDDPQGAATGESSGTDRR